MTTTDRYPAGTRVRSTISGWTGTILAHRSGSDGGTYDVRWDHNHYAGYAAPGLLEKLGCRECGADTDQAVCDDCAGLTDDPYLPEGTR